MELSRIDDYKLGWFVGNFEPTILASSEFEIGVKFFHKGDTEPFQFQKSSVELTVIVSGFVRIGNLNLSQGDILKIEPGEIANFEALSDGALVCVKSPSNPADKVVVT